MAASDRFLLETAGSAPTMTRIGICLSSEEHGPQALVRFAQMVESFGFRDVVVSDHYHPWIDEQGESPFVWSVIGGIAATTNLRVGTAVTCPTVRIHPAVVAQAAATSQLMLDGRFFFGVGSGENLNEHILGHRWPPTDVRLAMLDEAVAVMRRLWEGDTVSHEGRFYRVENARIYSAPSQPPPVLVSGFGPKAMASAAHIGDGYVNTGPDPSAIDRYHEAGGRGTTVATIKCCWSRDEKEARATVHRLWPNSGLPGQLAQELATPTLFEQATQLVDEAAAVGEKPCGPDADVHAESIRRCIDAGYDEVYVQQIGDDQEGFLRFYRDDVLPQVK